MKKENKEIYNKCNCNKEKAKKALKLLNKQEIENMIQEDGKAELVCQFCNQKYIFTKEELQNIRENN